ncbi:hypothetical protein D3C77_459590 [compost metagenome]
MSLDNLIAMLIWTAAGSVLLFVLMYVDSLFTRYKDLEEVKAGNMSVTTRLVLKLLAQGWILSSSISSSAFLTDALVVSVVSFFILLILEAVTRFLLHKGAKIDLDKGTQEGKVGYGLFAGILHIVGALIITATL